MHKMHTTPGCMHQGIFATVLQKYHRPRASSPPPPPAAPRLAALGAQDLDRGTTTTCVFGFLLKNFFRSRQ